MNTQRPVTIIGGGLAGLTLGIALRRCDVPVTIHEAGHYPRHRVCGEFINGRGRSTLEQLGLEPQLRAAGSHLASTACFNSPRAAGPVRPLPLPALCVSRFKLDSLLAGDFRRLGGELLSGDRWQGAEGAEGLVHASGRKLKSTVGGWRWFGLKVHARGVPLAADLEMHLSELGYVGLTQLADGVVNVCGLFRRRGTASDVRAGWQDYLRGRPGSLLQARLRDAEFDEASFCAVAGLDLRSQRAAGSRACRLGDALTMTPPFTGNGMSMAFESAELAVDPLCRWSRGEGDWPTTQREIARRCDETFTRRLRWAGWLQRLMLVAPLQNCLVRCLTGPCSWRFLFERTR